MPSSRSLRPSLAQLSPLIALAAVVLLISIAAVVLAGCGSSSPSVPRFSVSTPLPDAAPTSASASTSRTAAVHTDGPPSFVVRATTAEGDKVKVEGRFGSALPARESDVDQTALNECPSPTPNGRAFVVRLDLTTTLESSLAGDIELVTSTGRTRLVNFVLGFAHGATCHGEPGLIHVDLGTLQPQQSADFTMWLVLPDVMTPDDPHPSGQTLAVEGWFIEAPQPLVNGSDLYRNQHDSVSGPRAVQCENNGEVTKYLAVIGATPRTLTEQDIQNYEELCP
jgi:hypothetical protein